jgi:hypothetical protein
MGACRVIEGRQFWEVIEAWPCVRPREAVRADVVVGDVAITPNDTQALGGAAERAFWLGALVRHRLRTGPTGLGEGRECGEYRLLFGAGYHRMRSRKTQGFP